jgi:hypothetical protein
MSRVATTSLSLAVFALLTASAARPAEARSERTLSHPTAKVWSAAVRLLRVDLGLTITDKDEAAGYLVFELAEEGKTFRGTLELVPVDEGTARAIIDIEDRPDYMETGMLKKLERKLRVEASTPPR